MLKCLLVSLVFAPLLLGASPANAARVHSAIASGSVAPINSHPYVGRLEVRMPALSMSRFRIEPFCSGSLISSRYVLTAAHCIQGDGLENPDEAQIRVRFMNQEGRPAIKVVRVAYYGSYQNFSDSGSTDLALLELGWDASIKPVQLAAVTSEMTDSRLTELGYGQYQKNEAVMSEVLRQGFVTLPADQNKCITRDASWPKLRSDQICTIAQPQQGMLSGGCPGDSGGPLLSPAGELVGVASFGQYWNCEEPARKRSTVFARVSSGQQWLRHQTGQALFGLPAVQQNTAVPQQTKVLIKPVAGKKFNITASAVGQDWKAIIEISLEAMNGQGRYTKDLKYVLEPGRPTAQFKIPRGFRSSKTYSGGWIEARFYNSLMNGITIQRVVGLYPKPGPIKAVSFKADSGLPSQR